jgi:hypothetical protein
VVSLSRHPLTRTLCCPLHGHPESYDSTDRYTTCFLEVTLLRHTYRPWSRLSLSTRLGMDEREARIRPIKYFSRSCSGYRKSSYPRYRDRCSTLTSIFYLLSHVYISPCDSLSCITSRWYRIYARLCTRTCPHAHPHSSLRSVDHHSLSWSGR